MQISELFLCGRDCLHFGNTLLQGTEHLRAQPTGDKLPFLQESLCPTHRHNAWEEAPWQHLCLSLTSCFWTGLRINFWTPVKSKSSYASGRYPRAGRCPVRTNFFQVCFFLASWLLLFLWPKRACGLHRCGSGLGGHRQAAFCSITFLSAAPGEGVLQLVGFRELLSAHLFCLSEVFLEGKLLCFSLDSPRAWEVTFPISLRAQPLCKEVQPSDTAVLLHFHAN